MKTDVIYEGKPIPILNGNVSVIPSYKFREEWKSNFLLFDMVATVEHPHIFIYDAQWRYENNLGTKDDLLNLIKLYNGGYYVHSPYFDAGTRPDSSIEDIRDIIQQYTHFLEQHMKIYGAEETSRLVNEQKGIYGLNDEVQARGASLMNNYMTNKREYYPIIPQRAYFYNANDKYDKQKIFQVVLKDMPIVHPETPLEHLMDFKFSSDIRSEYYEMRNFITELGKSEPKEKDFTEKIEFVKHRTKRLLKKNNITIISGNIVSIVFSPFEGIVKAITNSTVSIVQGSAALTNSELSLQGRELSYLIRANQIFNPTK